MQKILMLFSLLLAMPAYAGFCFTKDKNVSTCDPHQIQSTIDASGSSTYGSVVLMEFQEPNKVSVTIIYPNNAPGVLAGKMTKNSMTFKKSGNSYEEVDRDGCIEKGGYKETKTEVIKTPRSLTGNCNPNLKHFFNQWKNQPDSFRKIYY